MLTSKESIPCFADGRIPLPGTCGVCDSGPAGIAVCDVGNDTGPPGLRPMPELITGQRR